MKTCSILSRPVSYPFRMIDKAYYSNTWIMGDSHNSIVYSMENQVAILSSCHWLTDMA